MTTAQVQSVSPTTQTKVGKTSIMRVMLCDGMIVLSLVILAELALQMWLPKYSHQLFDHEYSGSHPIAMNEQGHRGPTIALVKPEGEFRILALGDSVTWGTGVRASDAWPAQLQKQLGQSVRVINAAMPGASVDALTEAYQNNWKKYDVDAVVFVATANMVSRQWLSGDSPLPAQTWNIDTSQWSVVKKIRVRAKRISSQFCLPSFLSINTQRLMYRIGLLQHKMNADLPFGPMLAYGMVQPHFSRESSSKAWTQFDEAVNRMAAILKQDKVRLIICFATPRFATWQTTRDNEKQVPRQRLLIDAHEQFQNLCQKNDWTSVDLVEALQTARHDAADSPDLFITFDYNHLTPGGHGAVASAVKACFPR